MVKVKTNITARKKEFDAEKYPYEASVKIINADTLPTVYLFDSETKTVRRNFGKADSTHWITFKGNYQECERFIKERLAELKELEQNWLLNFLYEDSVAVYIISNGNITIENEEGE